MLLVPFGLSYYNPDGNISIRTNFFKNGIDALIILIPALATINVLLKNLKTASKAIRIINGVKIKLTAIKKYMSTFGIRFAIGSTIVGTALNLLSTFTGFTIGGAVTWVIKRYFFKSFKIKEKKYIY